MFFFRADFDRCGWFVGMLKLLLSRGLRIEAGEKRAREQKTKCDWPERGVAFRRSRTKHERETISIPALQALGDPQIAIASCRNAHSETLR